MAQSVVVRLLLLCGLAIKQYKKKHFRWKVHKFFCKLLNSKPKEEPLLYSNIPLFNIDYVEITEDLIKRNEVRFNFDSVILLSETSLIANSQDYKDVDLSQQLTLFVKLIRHELHGKGTCLFLETQSKNDNHYAFDRALNDVIYITKSINLPFFRLEYVRELLLIDSQVQNMFEDDFKESTSARWLLFSKKYFKNYDSYCYKKLSDHWKPYSKTKFTKCKNKKKKIYDLFHIPTYHKYREIEENNRKVELINESVPVPVESEEIKVG